MFTINNPLSVDIPRQWFDECEFITWQLEKGAQGTPHLQGYLVLKQNPKNKNGRTVKWVQDTFGKGPHYEKRMGTHTQATEYCNKEESRQDGPWTLGAWSEYEGPSRGGKKGGAAHKDKITEMVQDIKNGADDKVILEKYPRLSMSMTKGIEKARLIYARDQGRTQPYVVVFHGSTGTGKSHRAQAIADANGGGFTFRKGNGGNMWADGYDPLLHPVVIFDEMDGSFMSYRQLLRVCDKWPLVLDTKGGAVNFTPKIIVFTAHKHPKEWYSEDTVKDITELMRRLTGSFGAIIEMKIPYAALEDAQPDLIDVIDLLETGDLVDHFTSINQESEDVVDLTASDEDITNWDDLDEEEQRHFQDNYEDGITPPQSPDYDEIATASEILTASPRSSQREYTDRVSGVKRTLAFTATPVPPGVYKKAHVGPVQSQLAFVPTFSSRRKLYNDDDDEDDK